MPHITLQLLEHNAQASGSSEDKIDFRGFLLGALRSVRWRQRTAHSRLSLSAAQAVTRRAHDGAPLCACPPCSIAGNPSTDETYDNEGRLMFWWSHGLISQDVKK